MNSPIPGTVVIYGPFFARSGFGLLARGWAMALHQAGVKVRIVPVDCNDPNAAGDLDDCDLYLLQSLKYTPLNAPVTAIFAYVPTYVWPKVQLPEPCRRILLTTFDSSANAATPPPRLTFIGNQMDQVWVANRTEEQAWVRGGLNAEKIHSFNWPHEWIDNNLLGTPGVRTRRPGEPFRFLHISLFLPRRRLDVLIRAFLEEFRAANEAELVLKMTYPTWHPQPLKPKKDLHDLIARLRSETGSQASIVVDETLGTRMDLVKLIDSCDAYVSPDTTTTAPVSEAIFRHLPVIITDGWCADLPPQLFVVPNSAERIAITPEMAEYMPHQRGTSFPALDVNLMREALRRIFSLSAVERLERINGAAQYMRERYSYAATAPAAIAAIRQCWDDQRKPVVEIIERNITAAPVASKPLNLNWSGLQLFYGKIPTANREICLELLRRGHRLSLMPGNGPFHIEEFDLATSPKYQQLARRFYDALPAAADFNVSCRWHPVFNEQPAARQIMANTWSYGAIPNDWLRPIADSTSEVWVPSQFVGENFRRSGVAAAQLQVIPFGVDPLLFRPGIAPYALQTKKRFKFLFVGETTQRKGLDLVLNAYLKLFKRQDDVCLVIKDMDCEDFYGRLAAQAVIRECQANPRAPEIEYIPKMLSEENLAALYAACDCFVQPHRAAGFGLAVMEAMACGVPVITTEYGGVLDFCRPETAWLVPAREVRQRNGAVGHWKISGEQMHAEPSIRALQERMEHVFKNSAEAKQRAESAGEHIRANFSWAKTVDRIEARFQAMQSAPQPLIPRSPTTTSAPVKTEMKKDGPTIAIFAPFYNRSGYGVAARSLAVTLHAAGLKIKTVPVDNVEEGIDDCDMDWLKSLESTPVTLPVVAIFFHVPSPHWLQVQLPPQSVRIMFTTFDSSAQGNLPPAEWVSVCQQMDQLWLMTEKEASVFAAAGVPQSKIHLVKPPHPWINNPVLPVAPTAPKAAGKRFRFLCVSMFLPRRRWDTLIEAFLTEFKDTPDAELCLKVNYPSWHPVPGQPQRDLRQLIETLRARTGSQAEVILDESLDTRLGICRLMDSCDAYVSTDTSITAPVGEAFVRNKIAIIPDGYGVALPYCEGAFIIPVDPKLTQPLTEAMLAYQPHHRGKQMPLLRVADVRQALRAAYELPEAERLQKGHLASLTMECLYGASVATPYFLKAIDAGLREKFAPSKPGASQPPANSRSVKVDWIGSFLDFGSLSHVNRELTRALADSENVRLQCVNFPTVENSATPGELQQLANSLAKKASADSQITVRHSWPPNWQRPAQGKLVVIQPWEYGSLPQAWVAQSKNVDEFWVPSSYVRRVYVESGVPADKVVVVPNGVDPEKFNPQVAPMKLATGKSFKFLFVGGTIHRKGPDLLLAAYLKNFTAADDVCLVIKDFGGQSVYAGQTLESRIKALQAEPNAPEILYLNEELPADSLPGLYAACDCLVHPYRGEGFGLPVVEAMACGLPVVVTAGGSTDDFAGDEHAYRIPARRQGIGPEISGMKLVRDGWLLEPDVTALAEQLKWIAGHREAASAKGRAAGEYVRREWSWVRAAQIANTRLLALANRQTAAPTVRPARKSAEIILPATARLGQLHEARTLLGRKDFSSAWKSALAALAIRPFHCEAYLVLAEIAKAAGDHQQARVCATRAQQLAPNWKPAKQFLKSLPGKGRPTAWPALPEFPATPRLSICLITKNEERFLERCLASVCDLATQIVVLDTGSTDRTVEIAKKFNAEVHHFTWTDDFSTARNEALRHVTGDWILSLDADEELQPEHRQTILREIQTPGVMAYRLPIIDEGREREGCSYVPRLFRNAPGLFFVGRVHEQVFTSIEVRCQEWGLENRLGKSTLFHHGYTPEVVASRNKIERNLRLLERAIEELPDEPNLLMSLGLELVRSGQLVPGLERYWEAFHLMSSLPPKQIVPELRETLLTQLATHLLAAKRFDEIAQLSRTPLAQSASPTASQHFILGLAHLELKEAAECAEQMRQCVAKRSRPVLSPINAEILGAGPNHCLALSLAALKQTDAAEKAFHAALADDPQSRPVRFDFARFQAERGEPLEALKLLNELVTAGSDAIQAWQLGGQIALSRPELLDFARDWTGEAIKHFPQHPAILLQRAEALLLGGEAALAFPLWVAAHSPTSARQLAALVLCEMATGDSLRRFAPADEKLVSQEFLKWYTQLYNLGASALVARLNDQMPALREVLPTFANIWETAMRETEQAQPV